MKWCPVCSRQTDILKSIGTFPNPPLLFKWTSYMESFQNVTKWNAALTELNILSNLTQIWSDYICWWSVYFCWLLVQPQDHLCLQLTSQKKKAIWKSTSSNRPELPELLVVGGRFEGRHTWLLGLGCTWFQAQSSGFAPSVWPCEPGHPGPSSSPGHQEDTQHTGVRK